MSREEDAARRLREKARFALAPATRKKARLAAKTAARKGGEGSDTCVVVAARASAHRGARLAKLAKSAAVKDAKAPGEASSRQRNESINEVRKDVRFSFRPWYLLLHTLKAQYLHTRLA